MFMYRSKITVVVFIYIYTDNIYRCNSCTVIYYTVAINRSSHPVFCTPAYPDIITDPGHVRKIMMIT